MSIYELEVVDRRDDVAVTRLITMCEEAFFEGMRLDEPALEVCRQALRADGTRLVVARPTRRRHDAEVSDAATCWTSPGELTTCPGASVPAATVSALVVTPTHRRQGLMRRLMGEHLSFVSATGAAVSVLSASSAELYRRFGYGPATALWLAKIATTDPLEFRVPPTGDVVEVNVEAMEDEHRRLYDVVRRARPGATVRQSLEFTPPGWDMETGSRNPQRRCFAHLAGGAVDGLVYVTPVEEGNAVTLRVDDLVAVDGNAEAALIRLLSQIELTSSITRVRASSDWALLQRLVNPRAATITRVSDHMWMRLLDVAWALREREWCVDGRLRLAVRDPLDEVDVEPALGGGERCPSQTGTYDIEVASGKVRIEPTSQPARASVSLDDLASLYFGYASAEQLAQAGRLGGDAEAVGRLFLTRRAASTPAIF